MSKDRLKPKLRKRLCSQLLKNTKELEKLSKDIILLYYFRRRFYQQ